MLSVEGLSKSYGHDEFAVHDLSFGVPCGTITTLLGHNGAGKSTTLKVVAGILAPTSGSFTLDGARQEIGARNFNIRLRRRIGFLGETAQVLDYMTAREFLWYVGQLYGIDDDAVLADRVTFFVRTFAIEGAERRLVRELSAGQRRRVSISAALLNRPRLLLLDEPTNSLDPIGVRILKEYLLSARSDGCAVLLAIHRLDVAEQLSDAVVRLSVSCVGLWRGLIARRTFGGAIPAVAANSFTPVARMTLASATWMDTPSSVAPSRNSRANILSRRSSAIPSFQSLLRLATIASHLSSRVQLTG